MDSSGIDSMVGAHKKLKKQRKSFALANLQKETSEVFELASLHNFFKIYDQITDYKQILNKREEKDTISLQSSDVQTEDTSENFDNFKKAQENLVDEFLIFKGWVDEDTIRFPANGQPNEEETDGLVRKIQAKEQAICEARKIALEYFVRFSKSKSWVAFYQYRHHIYEKFFPIVDQGIAKFTKFDSKQNCTIIFEIRFLGLKAMAKNSVRFFKQGRMQKIK